MERIYIAIVVGTGSYNDLGIIRSLGEKKIPVYYVTDKIHAYPIHKSRYIVKTSYCDMTEKKLIETIKFICSECNAYGVVFPTSDITALYLDRNYISLKEFCSFSHARGRLEHEMDKLQMVNRAGTAGLNVPFSISADAGNLPNCVNFPCIVKPLASAFGEKSDIAMCNDFAELSIAAEAYVNKNSEKILIQDLVTNVKQEIAVAGLSLPDGDILIKGVVSKYCIMWNGCTIYGEFCVNENSNLYEKIKRYIHDVGYIGIFDMEFIEDNSGEYHFIECNYRNGAYGYAASAAGFNMPYIFFQSVTSQTWNYPQEMRSVVFMEEQFYVLNLLQKKISLWSWLKNTLTSDVFLYFNKKDIGPNLRIPPFVKRWFGKR